ncbi:MAG: archaellar assembly protein FlaJ, partial [Methanosarcinales archaeon]|nr:archaellar assembly protein FlaJ [Methanosarcinales archaeon]
MELKKVISSLEMPLGSYLKRFAIPVIAFGFIFAYILGAVLPNMFAGSARYILYVLPVICIGFAVAYPYSIAAGKALDIDHNMHYFITQFGALVNADTSRSEMFLIMSKNADLGSLADELGKIYLLTDTWNMGLSSACRFISQRTPSEMFADFLDRFAHATQSGEKMSDFLTSEQNVVMTDFETMYAASLTSVGVIIEMFISLVMSVIFMASFSAIMPIVTGMDATLLMSISVVSFVVMDLGILLFVKRTLPNDPIWHKLEIDTESDLKLKRSIPISLFGCLIAGLVATFLLQSLPMSVKIAIAVTPLVYTGRVASIEEAKIKRRDLNYPSFIRSLGSSAGARGGMINDALKSLKAHDFGPLTGNIHALYKRLNTRINKIGAWNLFSAETGSNLIQRFSEMFVQATHLGAKAEVVGELISTNFHRITTMRKKR